MSAILKPSRTVPKLTTTNIREVRLARGENQSTFWPKLGQTQSGGSRYECGRKVPRGTLMLAWLYLEGEITEEQLERAGKFAAGEKVPRRRRG